MNKFIYIILFSSILFSNHFLEILEEKNKESINFMNDYDVENGNDEQEKKNQLLAMGLSVILPGAGQLARFPGMRTKWLLAIHRWTFNEKNVSLFKLNVFLRTLFVN